MKDVPWRAVCRISHSPRSLKELLLRRSGRVCRLFSGR
jgi:hypothetical protein